MDSQQPIMMILRKGCINGLLIALYVIGFLSWVFDPLIVRFGPATLSVSWGIKPLFAMIAVPFIWVLFTKTGRATGPHPLAARISLGLGMITLTLAGLEGVLAMTGVRKPDPVFQVDKQDGQPVRADGSMVYDPDLLWRFQPGAEFNGRTVNHQGFLSRAVDTKKADGIVRVVCMGDSCTAQGLPTYADLLHERLQEKPPDNRTWEAFNTGVHGYTVMQGRAQFQKRVAAFHPDIVTLYFGWNSHWLADQSDAEAFAQQRVSILRAFIKGLSRKRLVSIWDQIMSSRKHRVLRVPEDLYVKEYSRMVREIRKTGAIPIVLTAPRAARIHRALAKLGHMVSVEEGIRLHDRYIELTRKVAIQEEAALIDLAAMNNHEADGHIFTSDGIHFRDLGRQIIADTLYRFLLENSHIR